MFAATGCYSCHRFGNAGGITGPDLTAPNLRVSISRKFIEEIEPSKIAPMPVNLLNLLTREEVLDLVACVISGGNQEHDFFRK